METLLTEAQKFVALTLAVLLIVVVALSTVHLGVLIAEEIWKPPRFLIPVQRILDIFALFLLVLIGVELLDTLKAYVKKDAISVRLVLEVALIAIARKVIILELGGVSGVKLLGMSFWPLPWPSTLRDKRERNSLLLLYKSSRGADAGKASPEWTCSARRCQTDITFKTDA